MNQANDSVRSLTKQLATARGALAEARPQAEQAGRGRRARGYRAQRQGKS